jgi:hypothetical protein
MAIPTANRRRRTLWLSLVAIALCAILVGSYLALRSTDDTAANNPSKNTSRVSTVLLGDDHVIAALYEPETENANRATGLILTHENDNFIGSIPCLELAKRGFTVLCVKSQYADQSAVEWDKLALDVSAGVDYLHQLPTVHKVVLVGWSGGGAIMSYYQNVAQNGLGACQAPERLDPCSDDLAHLPAADGIVLLDAIPGIAFSDLTALDASVTDEQNLTARDASLDMFSPSNGYHADTNVRYDTPFVERYLDGQSARENHLIGQAQTLRQQAANGAGQYSAHPPMPVGRDAARLWEADTSLLAHTRGKYPLISPAHPNGDIPQIVPSVRVSSAAPDDNNAWDRDKGGFTADTFLSVAAIRANHPRITADSLTGFDWASTNTATVNNVRGIKSPLLILSMTGHYWLVPSEMYYESATQATSRTLAFVQGATHGFTPCASCAATPGQFGDTVAETFNYVGNWLTSNIAS